MRVISHSLDTSNKARPPNMLYCFATKNIGVKYNNSIKDMATTVQDYTFYKIDHIEDDAACKTQRTLQNTQYSNYMTTNYFSEFPSDSQIQFATSQPAIVPNGTSGGSGVGKNIDSDTFLLLKTEQERSLGRLSLMERPFTTVPYLGRGSVDPTLESQLMQGEIVSDKKSVSTIMGQSFMGYTLYPTSNEMNEHVSNPKFTVEESALKGWTRGGFPSRDMSDDAKNGSHVRPSNGSY